jgi:oligopeptide/dipeptide ABC transporter ATP-binding protein
MSVLHVRDLRVEFGATPVVDGVDLDLASGEALGIVGESGSGKSMTALAILGLLPSSARLRAAALRIAGQDVLPLAPAARRALGGRVVSMVFQDPMTALNPVRRVGSLLVEAIRRHRPVPVATARQEALRALVDVGIPAPDTRLRAYPHELSGGLRQRVMIALALVNRPALILADEPTTALDTTIQAQILELMRERMRTAALVLITHDLGVAAELCRRIAVMYHGRIVETGPAEALLASPAHPYTRGLLSAVPRFDARRPRLTPIAGAPLSAHERLPGCAFAPRCPRVQDRCRMEAPVLTSITDQRRAACHFPEMAA